MVHLHNPEMVSVDKNTAAPIMHRHMLTATRRTRSFKEGESAECFIAKMSDGRFMVMGADFMNYTEHYEVFTEHELHESFSEPKEDQKAA
jgi:hypothetical protein